MVAIFGDTQARPQAVRVVQNADVWAHEATFAAGNEETAERVSVPFDRIRCRQAGLASQCETTLPDPHQRTLYRRRTTPDAGAAGTNYISRVESGWRFRRIRYLNPYLGP